MTVSATSTAAPIKADRVFVPLATQPYRWFASGRKQWELRRLGRQYTPKHLKLGRRVELRCGYADKNSALWGTLAETREAGSIAQFFDLVDFREVIPEANSREDAVHTAAQILGTGDVPVIGFRVDVDPVSELNLHTDYLSLVLSGQKRSTVRKGVRKIDGPLADLVAGSARVRVLLTDCAVKAFCELSLADAQRDGFRSLSELESALSRFYPSLSPSDPVTIIGFTTV
jgi:ASCH domain